MIYRLLLICFLFISFHPKNDKTPFLIISGIAQDAGYPQIGCEKNCCKRYWEHKTKKEKVSCLALVDPATNQKWIFDATPDFIEQTHALENIQKGNLAGIFITHAHIGHYTGLMYLGREAMNAKETPVYAMPRMCDFIKTNGPWSQLISLKNIQLQKLQADSTIRLTNKISVTPILVPHRDEFSETVGYLIKTENKTVLFIPDIDKWQKWSKDILTEIKSNDYLFLDGTFYSGQELEGRNMAEIPHPFVKESMEMFKDLIPNQKKKIWFIHFNHTNPLLDKSSKEYKEVKNKGFNVAYENLKILL